MAYLYQYIPHTDNSPCLIVPDNEACKACGYLDTSNGFAASAVAHDELCCGNDTKCMARKDEICITHIDDPADCC